MKPVAEWTERDILNLSLGEHDWLEIKGRRSIDLALDGVTEAKAAATLSSEISALANSGGGQLILGLVDQKRPSTIREVDEGGISLRVKKPNTKEWLENWISTLVEPHLRSFNVYVITRSGEDSQIGADQGLFVIEIGDSPDAPHQARDNKYYVRSASRSIPAGHQMVVDIFNRRRNPQFEVKLRHRPGRAPFMKKTHLIYTGKLTNTSRVMAHYVNLLLYIPEVLLNFDHSEQEWMAFQVDDFDGVPHFVYEHINTNSGLITAKNEKPTLYEPILPGRSREFLVNLPLAQDYDGYVQRSTLRIHYEVYADNAQKQSGYIPLQDIPG